MLTNSSASWFPIQAKKFLAEYYVCLIKKVVINFSTAIKINILQDNVATQLRCGGIFNLVSTWMGDCLRTVKPYQYTV